MTLQWHRGLPPTTEQVWDVVAKAMLLRIGGTAAFSMIEMANAAETQAEIAIAPDGHIHFRVEAN